MNDTRIQQTNALIDDARTILAELSEELPQGRDLNQVDAARCALNVALRHLATLTETCRSEPLGGGRCELPVGHEGKHFKAWTDRDGGFSWSDAGQGNLVKRFGGGLD